MLESREPRLNAEDLAGHGVRNRVGVEVEDERSSRLAGRLGLPAVRTGSLLDLDFLLAYGEDDVLTIRPVDRAFGPVCVDFVAGRAGFRRQNAGRRGEDVARAVGLGRGCERVVDATAGLGRDAFMLAWLGAQVIALERSPVIAALLADGLRRAVIHRATRAVAVDRIHLVVADAEDWLSGLPRTARPDVVFLDPMFPPRKKTARVKKEMQLFQALLGPDTGSDALLAVARRVATRRVVVKRPVHAPPLGPEPSLVISGRSTRFDVYLTP